MTAAVKNPKVNACRIAIVGNKRFVMMDQNFRKVSPPLVPCLRIYAFLLTDKYGFSAFSDVVQYRIGL